MASVPASPPTEPQSFGLLGSTSDVSGAAARVTRTVGADVKYAKPPVEPWPEGPVWRPDAARGPEHFAFKSAAADLARLQPLDRWRARLQAGLPDQAVTDKKAPAARTLATFARQLLTVADELHAKGWRLGLVHPRAILVDDTDPTRVFLPDLGFAWLGEVDPAKPAWLKAERADAAWWGGETRKQRQLAAPDHLAKHDGKGDAAWRAATDTQAVARLLQYLLTGAPDGTPPAAAARCPVWQALRKVETGQIATPAALRDEIVEGMRLRPEPITTGGGGGIPVGDPGPRRWIALGMLAVVVVAGLAAAWLLRGRDVASVTTAPSTGTEGTAPTTGSTTTQPTKRVVEPPVSGSLEALVDRAKKAIELAKTNPNDPEIPAVRAELMEKIQAAWNDKTRGGHLPLRSRMLQDLYKQLPAQAKPL